LCNHAAATIRSYDDTFIQSMNTLVNSYAF